ncbi:MAG TPA: PQQ-binding-like beta-propeller repeat protein [Tepidisphaeraceae bacterium]|jgi:outer membrane protein assembly factor BamB|nr:PQQ-binding-like beta-propeller repeat protein [Tepidisphaeraceae bacterium]
MFKPKTHRGGSCGENRVFRRSAFVALLIFASLAAAGESRQFTDPAPPAVLAASNAVLPATKNPDATFHADPKPLAKSAVTEDWPCFLGPTHDAFSRETKLLEKFPPGGPAVVWEMTKGEGYAEPVIAGDRLVLFHRVENNEVVDCLNASTGERFWRFQYPTAYQDRYGYCNGPRSTPSISDGKVFTYGAEGKVHCLQLNNGNPLWRRDLLAEFKLKQNFFGVGSSPLVEGKTLILNIGAAGGPCVAGFDVDSGKMRWGAGDQWGPSYASPISTTLVGKRRVLVFAGGESRPATGGLLCIDPANGAVDFTFPWRGTRRESVNASSPVVVGNEIFISECYGSGGTLLQVLPDMTCKQLWTNPQFGTHFMNAIPKDGYFYGVDGHGPEDAFICCVEIKTGKEAWRAQPEWSEVLKTRTGQRDVKLGAYRCNFLMVGGRCLCLGEFGHLLWLDLNPQGYKELDRAWLVSASETWTAPVVCRGLLYICQNTPGSRGESPRILCYDLRSGQ